MVVVPITDDVFDERKTPTRLVQPRLGAIVILPLNRSARRSSSMLLKVCAQSRFAFRNRTCSVFWPDPGDLSHFLIHVFAMIRLLHTLSGLAIGMYAVGTARAQTAPASACGLAIAASERAEGLPPQVLGAIGIVESGRVNPHTGVTEPWPWTINVAGAGHVFDTAAHAITAVQAAQAAGVQSIDVGCMQINLLHHPHAFTTLQDAFDPAANVRYAASFLARLHSQTGNWGAAIAAYHSATPALGLPYARTVALIWPLATRYGLTIPDPAAPSRAALEDEIDPHSVLTPEFRAQLVNAMLQRRREMPDQTSAISRTVVQRAPARLVGAFPVFAIPIVGRSRPTAPDRIALEDEVDPQRVLAPGFRAEMVAAAFAKHRNRISNLAEGFPDLPSEVALPRFVGSTRH